MTEHATKAEIERLKAEIFHTRKFWSDHADKDQTALRMMAGALAALVHELRHMDDFKELHEARAILAKLATKEL